MKKKYEADIENELLMYQSKANLDENCSFGKITHHVNPEIRKMIVKGIFGSKDSTFHFGP